MAAEEIRIGDVVRFVKARYPEYRLCLLTNGTLLNGVRVPAGKYVKLSRGDKITIGSANLVFG